MSNPVGTDAVTLSVIYSVVPAIISKRFELNGTQVIKYPGGALVRGQYQQIALAGAAELAAFVSALPPSCALTYGVAGVEFASIASETAATNGDIKRNRQTFDWPAGYGVLMLDYDSPKGGVPLPAEVVHSIFARVCPAFSQAPSVTIASTSTHIFNATTGEQLRGAGGLRVLLLVEDARDIPRAGQVFFDRLFLAGYGRFDVSTSGALLPRTLIDGSVWQPERLDFSGGAHCAPPLEQRRPAPRVLNDSARPMNTRSALPDLSVAERAELDRIKRRLRESMAVEQAEARQRWIVERLAQWDASNANMPDAERAAARSARCETLTQATGGYLCSDFELRHSSGQTVAVGEILADRARWHGERFADPMEPDYGNDNRIARANLRSGGKPHIWSHAHGGIRYLLIRSIQTMQIVGGEMPRLVRECSEAIALEGEVFQRGGELVRIADNQLFAVHPLWLKTYLESILTFVRFDARSKESRTVDSPGDLPDRIRADRGAWPMPEVRGLVHAPVLRPDGTLLSEPGYDEATGVMLIDNDGEQLPIKLEPTHDEVRGALVELLEPFAHFPFVTALDRSIHLAAALTAVQRVMLPTAPAFGYNAFKAGSGKGKAAKAVAWLSGQEPIESPWSTEPEEQRKRLMAKLLAAPPSLLIDNVNGALDSDTLCAILTATSYEDRRLGYSDSVSVSTRLLVLVTGNNLSVVGDLGRRVLVTTIDHGVESPERLPFPFCPVARVRDRWRYYRAAALTILRGFIAAGKPRHGTGSMGSFEEWDALIRQCICWLRHYDLAPFELADPADAVSVNYAADPDTTKLGALLHYWQARIGQRHVTCANLVDASLMDPELAAVLDEIAGDGGRINRRRLGRWIERHQGRVLNGLKIGRAGQSGGVARWCLVQIGGTGQHQGGLGGFRGFVQAQGGSSVSDNS